MLPDGDKNCNTRLYSEQDAPRLEVEGDVMNTPDRWARNGRRGGESQPINNS